MEGRKLSLFGNFRMALKEALPLFARFFLLQFLFCVIYYESLLFTFMLGLFRFFENGIGKTEDHILAIQLAFGLLLLVVFYNVLRSYFSCKRTRGIIRQCVASLFLIIPINFVLLWLLSKLGPAFLWQLMQLQRFSYWIPLVAYLLACGMLLFSRYRKQPQLSNHKEGGCR